MANVREVWAQIDAHVLEMTAGDHVVVAA